jgi:hypothetical protein
MSVTLKKVDGDIYIQGSNGRPQLIGGVEKLSQDIADCLMITYDPDRDFGHELDTVLGATSRHTFANVINASTVKQFVEEAIMRLRSVQRSRPDQVTDFESVDKVRDIKVYPLGKTGYIFFVEVTPVAGPDVNQQSFSIKLGHQLLETAGVEKLQGSNLDDFRT